MFDPDTLIITYDARRGEPRGPRARSADPKLGLADCVDCWICVQVCPTGIDIREGLQYDCIVCTACIDACDQVMRKMGYAPGLIRYSTENAMQYDWGAAQVMRRVFRARVLVYAAVLCSIVTALGISIVLRVPLKIDVIGDRVTLSREVEGGWIENVYRLQIINTEEAAHLYRIRANGLRGLDVAGADLVEMPAATTRMVPVKLRVPPGSAEPGSHRIEFRVEALGDERLAALERSIFLVR